VWSRSPAAGLAAGGREHLVSVSAEHRLAHCLGDVVGVHRRFGSVVDVPDRCQLDPVVADHLGEFVDQDGAELLDPGRTAVDQHVGADMDVHPGGRGVSTAARFSVRSTDERIVSSTPSSRASTPSGRPFVPRPWNGTHRSPATTSSGDSILIGTLVGAR
jgi:hypothetical protein